MTRLPLPVEDDLFVSEVAEHSQDKHYFLERYLHAFTTGMKGKRWRGLHYIDLFAGAGLERLKDSGTLNWGSPMIAALTDPSFDRLHICEKNESRFDALMRRVHAVRPDAQILRGDANEKVHEIVRTVPRGTLSVAFLDPYGLHLEFGTLTELSNVRADLIIFFPDHLDALRNWESNYLHDSNSNLDRCFGKGCDWRTRLESVPRSRRVDVLRELYVEQIGTLGYTEFDYERICMASGHPLYRLIFCSKNSAATRIWRGISRTKPDGQRDFDFPEG